MATYTIKTSREQEIGLKFNYDHYADKTKYPTQAEYFQSEINHRVTDPMYRDYLQSKSVALDKSIATIPEANMPAAEEDIKEVIVQHGGTLVPAGPPPNPFPPPGVMNAPAPIEPEN